MFPVESLKKKNPWSIFQGCIWKGENRPLLCWTNIPDIGSFRAQTQAGFQSLRLGLPGSTALVKGTSETQPPGLGSLLWDQDLEFVNFLLQAHPDMWPSLSPVQAHPASVASFSWDGGEREPWASGDPFPAPT